MTVLPVDEDVYKRLEYFAHTKWLSMINRVGTRREYSDVEVCDEWLIFNNFYSWFADQYYEDGWHLDKDLLSIGNRIYSPKTCIMIPPEINQSIKRPGGKLKIGVRAVFINDKDRFKVSFGGNIIGFFDDYDEAVNKWISYKARSILYMSDNVSLPSKTQEHKIKTALSVFVENMCDHKIELEVPEALE